jgi:hypothetical protein
MSVTTCLQTLERHDLEQVKEITGPNITYDFIEKLREQTDNEVSKQSLVMLSPSLAHIKQFTSDTEQSFDSRVNYSTLWGMIYLNVKV